MDEKIKNSLKFLWLGYMLFFCIAFIPYFGLLIGFKGSKIATIMLFPMIAWWIFFFIFLFSRNLGHEAKYIKKENAMKTSYIISIISCSLNVVFQIFILIFSKKITILPMILSVLSKNTSVIIFAILALFSGAMTFTPLYMHQFTNANLTYFVKHTTTTYHSFGYSETKTSDKFIPSGQFVRMSLLSAFLSIIVSATPAIIVVLIVDIVKLKTIDKR